jgi:hypothetical protein
LKNGQRTHAGAKKQQPSATQESIWLNDSKQNIEYIFALKPQHSHKYADKYRHMLSIGL